MKRTLTLKRETLTELASDELGLVQGAALPSVFCTSAVTFCDIVCTAVQKVQNLTPGLINTPTDGCPTFLCTGPTI